MANNTLTVTDNRTGTTYTLPVENGTIKAMDLRQIKTGADDFGLMSYDPAFTNTASCRSSVTYIDGNIANIGDRIVTHAVVRVTFRDLYGQVAQIEDVPIKLLQTSGPYPDTVDLAAAPLASGQNEPFRLIFEHVSEQWNQAAPELKINFVS